MEYLDSRYVRIVSENVYGMVMGTSGDKYVVKDEHGKIHYCPRSDLKVIG